jgi:hypothetical protein
VVDILIVGIVGISTGRTASLTLEDIAVTFPSIEDVTPAFDDPFWRGGDPMLLIAKTDGKLYSFGASTNLEASFRFPNRNRIRAGSRTFAIRASSATAPRLRCQSTAAHEWGIRRSTSSRWTTGPTAKFPIRAGDYASWRVDDTFSRPSDPPYAVLQDWMRTYRVRLGHCRFLDGDWRRLHPPRHQQRRVLFQRHSDRQAQRFVRCGDLRGRPDGVPVQHEHRDIRAGRGDLLEHARGAVLRHGLGPRQGLQQQREHPAARRRVGGVSIRNNADSATTLAIGDGALGNYANDAAASGGGVAVGQMYRNGSVLMQRIT